MPSLEPQPLPELPDLDAGITLLETDSRSREALHSLVLDHVLCEDNPAYWIDTHGHATTRPLGTLAPNPRVLDRIHVARGFTPFQHYTLVEDFTTHASRIQPGLLVVPALDGQYRGDEVRQTEGREMLLRTLAMLAGVARRRDLPILVTRTGADEFAAPVEAVAAETIRFEQTAMGPRFSAQDFETLVYPAGRGYVQTTLAFWQRVLSARQPIHEVTTSETPGVTASGAY